MNNQELKYSNPVEQKSLKNIVKFFKNFNNIFENDVIDEIIKNEFPHRKYALLPLLVKAQIYSNQQ